MDCSWVKNISKRRPIQPSVFYDNKKGTFDVERICLGLNIDEIQYTKLLEYITLLVSQAGNSRALSRDIRRRLRKTLDPILHNLPSAWVAKCIDELICKVTSNLASAKRHERAKASEPRKELPQNQKPRLPQKPCSNINPEPCAEVSVGMMPVPNHTAWPPPGYPVAFHNPYDPTQFSRGRIVSSTCFDNDYRRNSEGIVGDFIRPTRVSVKREYEPEDTVIGRSVKGYVVSRDTADPTHQLYRATADRYIPEYEFDRFTTQSSFPPIGSTAPESRPPPRNPEVQAPVIRTSYDGVPERRIEQKTPGVRALEETAPDRRIEERASRVQFLQEKTSQRVGEQTPQVQISEERAPDQPVEEKALILRARDHQVEETALVLRAPNQKVEEKALVLRTPKARFPEKQSEKPKIIGPAFQKPISKKKTSNVQGSKKKVSEQASNELAVKARSLGQQNPSDKGSDGQISGEKALADTCNGACLQNLGKEKEPDKNELPQEKLTKNLDERVNPQVEISTGESIISGLKFSSQTKTPKRVPINEIAFMARRGTSDWVLLGTGDDLLGSSSTPDWDIFLSRLKAGLEFSLINDKLYCPWLSYTNGEELVGIFDAFGWRAGLGNMLRRGLREFRFEVKKQDVQMVINKQQLDRSSSLSSLDSYNDE